MFHRTAPLTVAETASEQALADRWTTTVETAVRTHQLTNYWISTGWQPHAHVEITVANLAEAYDLAGLLAGSGAIGIHVHSDPYTIIHTLVIATTPVTVRWSQSPLMRGGHHVDASSSVMATTANHPNGATS